MIIPNKTPVDLAGYLGIGVSTFIMFGIILGFASLIKLFWTYLF